MSNSEWFQTAFGEDYTLRYAHRNDVLAEKEVGFLNRILDLASKDTILDVGCGSGRHLKILRRYSSRVFGLDLSAILLNSLKLSWHPEIPQVVRGDMRYLPYHARAFDIIVMLFTSFGYFSDEDNEILIAELARVLTPSGRLVLDLINKPQLENTLTAHTIEQTGPWTVESTRILRNKRIEKDIVMKRPGETRQYQESVRLYTLDEISAALEKYGLNVKQVYGDFDCSELSINSPRMLILAEQSISSR
ncbi:class I SAM-dependent methyltransferase [Planctomycetota bacterium]